MTRQRARRSRAFCIYCGTVISAYARTCNRHREAARRDPHLDGVPADPAYSLPTMAEQAAHEREDCKPTEGKATR